jgi:hypothetical protein
VSAGRSGAVAGAWLASLMALVALTALGDKPAAGAGPAAPPLRSTVVRDVGSGYAVTWAGAPEDASFAGAWVNPNALSSVLTHSDAVASYERAWQGQDRADIVQILALRFSSTGASRVFAHAAEGTLRSSAVVSSDPLPSVPGARRTSYVTRAGFGQAMVLQTDDDVALLCFVSHPAASAAPITAADADRVADAQHAAMARAPGGPAAVAAAAPAKGDASVSDLTWAALAVAVMAAGLATPLVLRRRRGQRGAP